MAVRKVIAAVDGGVRTADVLRFAAVIARDTRADLIVAHAYRYDPPFQSHEARMLLRGEAMESLQRWELSLPYGSRATLRAVECRSPVQGLHSLAEAEHADVLVIGAGRAAHDMHPAGSTAERLLHASPCAVAVAPPGYAHEENPGLRVIGVAYDGSEDSAHALELARQIALECAATVRLIGVVEHHMPPAAGLSSTTAPVPADEALRDVMLEKLELAADGLPARLRPEILLAMGEPAAQITEHAAGLSLLVTGSRGYGPLRRSLLGSVTRPILRAAPCPLLVMPRGASHPVAEHAAHG